MGLPRSAWRTPRSPLFQTQGEQVITVSFGDGRWPYRVRLDLVGQHELLATIEDLPHDTALRDDIADATTRWVEFATGQLWAWRWSTKAMFELRVAGTIPASETMAIPANQIEKVEGPCSKG